MGEIGYCPVCQMESARVEGTSGFEGTAVRCRHCGNFAITDEANRIVLNQLGADRLRLAGAIREASERSNEHPVIRTDNIDAYLSSAPQNNDVSGKVRKLVSAIARRSKFPGDWRSFGSPYDATLAYASNWGELLYLTEYCVGQGWTEKRYVEMGGGDFEMCLTPAGWEEVQRRPRLESSQGFVAMWFDSAMTDAFTNGMKPAVEDDCHYRCRRIDAKEYNGDVVDEIMLEIRESRFVVCDLTGHRNGVYFEAGFAIGLGIPTIWTCRDDHARETHFDAEHFNQIRWASPDELRKKLATRIRATIGLGLVQPVPS